MKKCFGFVTQKYEYIPFQQGLKIDLIVEFSCLHVSSFHHNKDYKLKSKITLYSIILLIFHYNKDYNIISGLKNGSPLYILSITTRIVMCTAMLHLHSICFPLQQGTQKSGWQNAVSRSILWIRDNYFM